jgi:PKD repeat protein
MKNQKGSVTVWIIIILVIVIVVGAAWWYLMQAQTPSTSTTSTTEIPITQQTTGASTQQQTSNTSQAPTPSNQATQPQSVSNKPSSSGALSATPTSGSSPLTVTFSSLYGGPTGVPGGYRIDFGDGTSKYANCDQYSIIGTNDVCGSPAQVQHTYNTPGTYTATLTDVNAAPPPSTATSDAGVVGTVTITVQ